MFKKLLRVALIVAGVTATSFILMACSNENDDKENSNSVYKTKYYNPVVFFSSMGVDNLISIEIDTEVDEEGKIIGLDENDNFQLTLANGIARREWNEYFKYSVQAITVGGFTIDTILYKDGAIFRTGRRRLDYINNFTFALYGGSELDSISKGDSTIIAGMISRQSNIGTANFQIGEEIRVVDERLW